MTDGSRELIAKTWIPQGTASASVATNGTTLFSASAVASIGALAAGGVRTRFCEVYNPSTNTVHCKLYTTGTTGSGTAAATLGDRPVPSGVIRIFQVPQGGQGMLSCIAATGAGSVVVNWGVGRG
jgi:hypothetical protein